jgi:hypothetical protein
MILNFATLYQRNGNEAYTKSLCQLLDQSYQPMSYAPE